MQNQPLYSGWFLCIFGEMLKSRLFFSFAFVLSLLVVSGCSSDVEYGELVDSRDGQVYKTVVIGEQTWMAENLNFMPASDSSRLSPLSPLYPRTSCYARKDSNCTKYGRLYRWSSAMDSIGEYSTDGKGCGYRRYCERFGRIRGICPEGWHLPSEDEFTVLLKKVAPYGRSNIGVPDWRDAGFPLMVKGEWNEKEATNSTGFSALPAGLRNFYGRYGHIGKQAYFWTSTESNGWAATSLIFYPGGTLLLERAGEKRLGQSVRCIKD